MDNSLQTIKISELPEAITLNESDYSFIVQNGTSKKIKGLLLKGNAGDNGKSIEIQKTDTHIQWRQEGGQWINLVALADLKGDKGEQGLQGIKGDKGEQGRDGANAVNPNFTIGTVTTLPSNSDTTVTLTGTYPNLVLNFGIPRGADGSGGGSGLTSEQTNNIAKIPAIQSTVDALPNNYASKVHNHSEYASSSHRHDASEIDNLPSGGGVSQEDINTAVNNYLTEHPVQSGATAEQAAQIQTNTAAIGTEELTTTAKTLKGAINEVFQDVDNGKTLIASAITGKGIVTSNNDTFQVMADNILSISSSTQPSGQDAYRKGRVLVWEDDFNGDSLDTSVWNYELGNIRNNELQVYTNNSKNVYVENSNLVLKAIKEDCEAYDKKTQQIKTFNWTSGSVHTNNKKEFKYGRIEAKIKLTNVQGSFPAFWTLGAGYDYQYTNDANMGNKGVLWPFCGEIDIMEHFGFNASTSHGSYYSISESNNQSISLGRSSSKALDFNQYHIYSLEWIEDKLEIFVDDILVSSANISDPKFVSFKQPHFILLNHAMGASGGTPSDSLTECYFYVDWVRVYAPLISSITLSESNITLSKIGDTNILTADFKPDEACDKTLVWESSNPDIAKVYGGKIHAISNGTCNITAKHEDVSATCSVTVGTGVVTSTLNSISAVYTQGNTIVYPDTPLDSLKSNLVVTGSYSDGTTKPITGYSLSGALTVGTSTVTVTYNNKTTTFDVVVSETPATEENVLFSFDSSVGSDIDTVFNTTKNNTSSTRCETVYNSDGYLEIAEVQKGVGLQDGYIRIEPKNFAVSGNLEIEAQLSIEFHGDTRLTLEGVRIGIDNGTEGIYVSLNPNFGVRYFKGASANPTSTATKGEITNGTMFNLKINIDFANKNNAKIYLNDTLLDTINYSNWTKSAYSNRNNFFIMARNATATVNTIKIKNI